MSLWTDITHSPLVELAKHGSQVVHGVEEVASLSLGDYTLIGLGIVMIIIAVSSYSKNTVTKITNVIPSKATPTIGEAAGAVVA